LLGALLLIPSVAFGQARLGAAVNGTPSSFTATTQAQAVPVASAVHADLKGDQARLVFDLSAPVQADAFVLANPMRVVVDLPEVNFELDPQIGQPAAAVPRHARGKPPSAAAPGPAALIAAYRFGLFAPGRSRIVIDLSAPVRIEQAASEAAPGKNPQFVIELTRTDGASFAAAARQAEAVATAQPTSQLAPPALHDADAKPIIVLDPGHGGIDTGAIGGKGIVEKQIVLDFAKELGVKLEASGRYKVVMTRSTDVFVPLGERVRMARESDAALFISVHADDLVDGGSSVSGATVYTASDRASDAAAARLADAENRADAAGGVRGKDDPTDVSDILLDLTRRETRVYSNVFARTLVNYWKVAARLNKNPRRSAGFVVLGAPDVPSVLLELGYLSSPKDTAELLSPEWRDRATDSVLGSVDGFFAQRQTQVPTADAGVAGSAGEPAGVAVSQH
jgi:N-acetylmuramoyl-L-alanine amidase